MYVKDKKMLINIEEALNLMLLREKKEFGKQQNKLDLTNTQQKLRISDKDTVRRERTV